MKTPAQWLDEGNRALDAGRRCDRCEFFDYGIADAQGHSDCLNNSAPRFQTYAHWTCGSFFPDTTR